MRWRILLVLVLVGVPAVAQTDDAPSLAVRVKRAWVGGANPSGVPAGNVMLIVQKGVLTSIAAGNAPLPAGIEVVEWPEGTAMPGLVLAHSRGLSPIADVVDAETPDAVAADGFDPFLPRLRWLRNGITVAYLVPGQNRLVTGMGSVVRLGVAPGADTTINPTLRRQASLRLNLGEGPRRTPPIYRPPLLPGPDAPLPPSEPQFARTRAGAIAEIRSLFGRAAADKATSRPRAEGEVDLRPFIAALDGRLPVCIAADRRADIEGAIALAREFRFRLIIEGGNEAWKVALALAAVDAAVVLRTGAVAPVPEGATPAYFRADGEGHPDAAALLTAAGVPVALIPPADGADENLLFHAGRSIGPGFSREQALASITSVPARLYGLGDSAGVLATGKAADLLVFAGDPFESAATPVLVFSGGRLARRLAKRDGLVALTVGRIHTCDGDALDNATIVVEDGRIRALGRHVTIPPEARRIIDPTAVIVPGFVDAGGQVGLRGMTTSADDVLGPPPATGSLGLEQPITRYFDAELPTLTAVARAGVTTVALSPGGGRLVSGALATVKTFGGQKTRVVRTTSGILFDLGTSPANDQARRALGVLLDTGKKYADSFGAYETALAEWEKTGQKPAAADAKARTIGPVTAPKPRDPITGTWQGSARSPVFPRAIAFTLVVKLEGETVKGTITSTMARGRTLDVEGTFSGSKFRYDAEVEKTHVHAEATVGRDEMNGEITVTGLGEGTFEATREARSGGEEPAGDSKPAPAKAADSRPAEGQPADDGRPKPPKIDASLEPYRELFAERVAAFVVCPSEAHAEIALAVFRTRFELKTVIIPAQDLRVMLDRYRAAGVALSPSGDSIHEEDGVLVNPAELALRQKIPVLFRSGWGGDPRQLYGIADLAVHHGVDPEDALRMITRQPARFLGVLDRVGSLERGKDADLVILSGEPFAAGTRVKRTMVEGRFTDEEAAR